MVELDTWQLIRPTVIIASRGNSLIYTRGAIGHVRSRAYDRVQLRTRPSSQLRPDGKTNIRMKKLKLTNAPTITLPCLYTILYRRRAVWQKLWPSAGGTSACAMQGKAACHTVGAQYHMHRAHPHSILVSITNATMPRARRASIKSQLREAL